MLCARSEESVDSSSSLRSEAAVISTTSTAMTGNFLNHLITGTMAMAPTSRTLHWPVAVHKPIQPVSQNELATATGLTTSQLEPNAAGTMITQCPTSALGTYAGLGKGKLIVVNRNASGSLVDAGNAPVGLQCIVSQAAGKPAAKHRCLILRPVFTAAMPTNLGPGIVTGCRPNAPAVPCVNYSAAANSQPAVHAGIRHIVMPRAIPRATFRVAASTTASAYRVIRAKTAAVPAPKHPPTSASNCMQGLAVIRSTSTPCQPAATTDTGKDSPLSCIQTLVANADSAMQWIAINDDKIPQHDCSGQSALAATDENDMIIHQSISADNTNNKSGFAGITADNLDFKQLSSVARKRLSTADDLLNKVAKQS